MNMVRLTLLLAILLLPGLANAQDDGHKLFDKVTTARNSGAEFPQRVLFRDGGQASDTFLSKYRIYTPLDANIKGLYDEKPQSLSLVLRGANGKQYTLELVRSSPVSADAHITYMDANGLHKSPYETGLHYQGIVNDAEMSLAAVSVFSNGEVMILFSNDDGNFNMGKFEDDNHHYILYNSKDRLKDIPFHCAAPDTGAINAGGRSANKTTGAIGCNKLRVYWEADYTFYQAKGSVAAVQNYLTGIFNFMQSIYYDEGMAVELSSMHIWTIDDPIIATNAYDALFRYDSYWLSQGYTYYGEQAHLISDYSGSEGIAYQGLICNSGGYASSNLVGQQSNSYPVYDRDVYIVSHETGHTIGARHTQSCNWNTGPNGSCGSIDDCTTQEAGAGCTTCFSLHNSQSQSFKGTIMSYCGSKINFAEGFGPIVGDYLRDRYKSSSCFKQVISPKLITKDICNSDGAVTLSYQPNNFGVFPYTYSWSNGPKTKDISGLSTPGTYTVNITDSNNCTATATATVDNYAKPGDGIALSGTMPYCCKDTSYDVTINATLPANLTNCQTVAWLRTIQPVNSYAGFKTAYANANQADLLPSTNDTSIDNVTAAILKVKSPASCTTTTIHYYTPYVSYKATTKSVYTTNASNATDIKAVNVNIGTNMIIASEPQYPTACEKSITNISDTIIVTISNYTGRANKLTIRIIGDDNTELFSKWNFAGNGTYRIPINTNDHFQQMTIKAFDYNCNSSCTTTTLNMLATRAVTYHARQSLLFDSSCVAGKSVLLSFGPDSCNLGIDEVSSTLQHISLYPNPAQTSATLSFYANAPGACTIALQDIAGRTLRKEALTFEQGRISKVIDLNGITAGVYMIQLTEETNDVHNLKLVVQ